MSPIPRKDERLGADQDPTVTSFRSSPGSSYESKCCQWPGCRFWGTRRLKRGIQMRAVYCCTLHAKAFHLATNGQIHSIEWQPVRIWEAT